MSGQSFLMGIHNSALGRCGLDDRLNYLKPAVLLASFEPRDPPLHFVPQQVVLQSKAACVLYQVE